MTGLFEDRVVMVTGGTKGIGLAAAAKFAQEGAKLVVTSSQQKNVDTAAAELRELGGDVLGVACDMGNREQIEALFSATKDTYGELDVCVCSAGICPWTLLPEVTQEELDRTLDINVKGLFRVSQMAAEMMKAKGSGAIVHIGSMAGLLADPEGGLATYCASKGAVHLLTKAMAVEFGPHGIRVNCVAPGWIATDMNVELRADEELMKKYYELIPLGRVGEPEEAAELIAFLASEEASFVNGAVVLIDGGNVCV